MTKTCTKCNTSKQQDEFYKNSKYKDGYTTYCKSCMREIKKAQYYAGTKEDYTNHFLIHFGFYDKNVVRKISDLSKYHIADAL